MKWLRSLLPHLILVPASVVAMYPVLWVLKTALSASGGLDPSPSIVPEAASLVHFERVLFDGGRTLFLRQLLNSFVVAFGASVAGLVLSASAAFAFSRVRFMGRELGLRGLMLTQLFPTLVMIVPLYVILEKLELLNSLWGLALVYGSTTVPFATWMLKTAFDVLPKELEEAAAMDGATLWVTFSRIFLPLARPALAVTGLFAFMSGWNEFVLASTFLNEARLFTVPVALQRYVGQYSTSWGEFAAGSVLASVPVVLVFYALQRHLVSGLTKGAVKG